ncbi:MAG TPA: hypothetical protein VG711_07840, partial [Phycisphaerales bacterium]|nr:hypothetical protein [Phycisphaerales bacterium]
ASHESAPANSSHSETARQIRANEFILQEDNGRVAATLRVLDNHNASLTFMDQEGKGRIVIGNSSDGAIISILDPKSQARIALATDKVGNPNITLMDSRGSINARLESSNESAMLVFCRESVPTLMLGQIKEGSGLFFVNDKSAPTASLSTNGETQPVLKFFDIGNTGSDPVLSIGALDNRGVIARQNGPIAIKSGDSIVWKAP